MGLIQLLSHGKLIGPHVMEDHPHTIQLSLQILDVNSLSILGVDGVSM